MQHASNNVIVSAIYIVCHHTQLAETHHAVIDQFTSSVFSHLITGGDQNLSRYTRSFVHSIYYDDIQVRVREWV